MVRGHCRDIAKIIFKLPQAPGNWTDLSVIWRNESTKSAALQAVFKNKKLGCLVYKKTQGTYSTAVICKCHRSWVTGFINPACFTFNGLGA